MARTRKKETVKEEEEVKIRLEEVELEGTLAVPKNAKGLVIFAHGSGSSRFSPRHRYVAEVLQKAGIATLLFDLLTKEEEAEDEVTSELRFDIPFLAERLLAVTDWVKKNEKTKNLSVGYLGASTGAAAALVAAARGDVRAVVSRGGRPDLATESLPRVKASTLLIVGGNDVPVIAMNEDAMRQMRCIKKLEIVPGASHLFEEPGALEEVARLATEWFKRYLVVE